MNKECAAVDAVVTHTHTHTTVLLLFWNMSGTTRVSRYTHTHTQPFYGSVEFVRENPGEPVPEEH